MVIISKTKLVEFGERHPDAIESLNEWWVKSKVADWSNSQDVKNTFNSVDSIGNDRYVFNIRKNKYRLVVMIHFQVRTVYVRFIGTHMAYDKIDCKTI